MIAVGLVLLAALVVGLRRRRPPEDPDGPLRARPRPPRRRHRRRGRGPALLLVTALVGGLALIGSPASAQAFDCKAPPDPDRPGTGLVGSLDPAPIGVGTPGSVYDEVGYAGQVWWTYDLGCGSSGVRDPAAATDTWLGNQAFDVAKVAVGGVNWAHYLLQRGSGLLAPLDGIVTAGTRAMYEAVFTTFAGIALAVLAAVLLLLAVRGELSRQARRAGVAVVALALASAAYAAPVAWSGALDGVLLDGATAMQQGFLAQAGAGDANTLPTVLTDQVVYDNWLRGEFGSADVPQARDDGRDLLRAQTFTKREVAAGADGPAASDAKKAQFTDIAGRVGDRYSYLQGRSGSRTGAGVLALVQAGCIALFQLMSKVLVLVSMLVIRLLVMTAPALAVLALLRPGVLPSILRIAGAALVNTLLVGALAGLHSLMVVALFRPGSGVDTWLALLVTGVVTVVLWAVARPFRRLAAMVSLTRDELGGVLPATATGALGRALGRWRGDRAVEGAGAGRPGVGTRPEEGTRGPAVVPERRPVRVDAEVVRDAATTRAVAGPPTRAALPAGGAGTSVGGRDRPAGAGPAVVEPGVERTIYRRSDAAGPTVAGPTAAAPRPTATAADRIYHPAPRQTTGARAGGGRGGTRADPD